MKITAPTAPELVSQLLAALSESGSKDAEALLCELKSKSSINTLAEVLGVRPGDGTAVRRSLAPPQSISGQFGFSQGREPSLPLRIPLGDNLRNPLIPKGQYDVVCSMVWTGGSEGDEIPTCVVSVRILPLEMVDEKVRNQVLFVILRNTERTKALHDRFCQTFRICTSYNEAIGRVGRVYVKDDICNEIVYSGVHFMEQSMDMRRDAETLQAEYNLGRVGKPRSIDYSIGYLPEEVACITTAVYSPETPRQSQDHRPNAWNTGLPSGKQPGQG